MPDALLLAAASAFAALGMAWLAMAIEVHWAQVRRTGLPPVRVLRCMGAGGLAASLALCLAVDHASMATLVWVMALAAAALVVAFVLAFWPHWLRMLVFFFR